MPISRKRAACADADAVALDVVGAQRGGVEKEVDEVVGEQVDLVDVEDPAMSGGKQARLEGAHALRERPLDVERAGNAVRGSADRELDEPHAARRSATGSACGAAGHSGSGSAGSQPNSHPATTATGGNRRTSERTAVDFAVPFSPRTRTPPTPGSTAFTSSAQAQVLVADDRRKRKRPHAVAPITALGWAIAGAPPRPGLDHVAKRLEVARLLHQVGQGVHPRLPERGEARAARKPVPPALGRDPRKQGTPQLVALERAVERGPEHEARASHPSPPSAVANSASPPSRRVRPWRIS